MKLLKQIAPLFLIMNIFPAIVRIFVLDKIYLPDPSTSGFKAPDEWVWPLIFLVTLTNVSVFVMIYNKWADEYNPKTGLTFGLLFSVPIVIGINLFLYAVTTLDDNILNMVMNMINFTLWWCVWCTVRVYNTKNGNSIINETISTYIAHLNPKIP